MRNTGSSRPSSRRCSRFPAPRRRFRPCRRAGRRGRKCPPPTAAKPDAAEVSSVKAVAELVLFPTRRGSPLAASAGRAASPAAAAPIATAPYRSRSRREAAGSRAGVVLWLSGVRPSASEACALSVAISASRVASRTSRSAVVGSLGCSRMVSSQRLRASTPAATGCRTGQRGRHGEEYTLRSRWRRGAAGGAMTSTSRLRASPRSLVRKGTPWIVPPGCHV